MSLADNMDHVNLGSPRYSLTSYQCLIDEIIYYCAVWRAQTCNGLLNRCIICWIYHTNSSGGGAAGVETSYFLSSWNNLQSCGTPSQHKMFIINTARGMLIIHTAPSSTLITWRSTMHYDAIQISTLWLVTLLPMIPTNALTIRNTFVWELL